MLRGMLCPRAQAGIFLLLCALGEASAQTACDRDDSTRAHAVPVFLASPRDEQSRTLDLTDVAHSSLIRSASASVAAWSRARHCRFEWSIIAPYVESTWNSRIPFSLNDGAQWAGRGWTGLAGGGVLGVVGPVRFLIAPEIWHTENRAFPILPGGDSTRSAFASPWYVVPISADLPLRFGSAPTTALAPGQSSAWLTTESVAYGVSSENEWWGPAIRNAILMSNNAEGFPHVFVRTARPIRALGGSWRGNWIAGVLSESRFFDQNQGNNLRSVSGAIITFSPFAEPPLTLGIARVVFSRMSHLWQLPIRSLDVITRRGEGRQLSSTRLSSRQLISLFGQWRMPHSSAEVYAEWARLRIPVSPWSFLVAPQATQGYTLGAQWLPALSPKSRLRVQLELTNLEQSAPSRDADTISFYTSGTIAQGYTQRGQVIGAAIGPGSSSQWLAADLVRDTQTIGLFAGRIRWNTDAYYRQQTSVTTYSYDVSVFGGIRATAHVLGRDLGIEITRQLRYNYLFQNAARGYSANGAFDRHNTTVRLRLY